MPMRRPSWLKAIARMRPSFGRIFIVCATGKSAQGDARDPLAPHAQYTRKQNCRRQPSSSARSRTSACESGWQRRNEDAAFGMSISTHILDTAIGRPAAGIAVELDRNAEGEWQTLNAADTDVDGRVKFLLPEGMRTMLPGLYCARFRDRRVLPA